MYVHTVRVNLVTEDTFKRSLQDLISDVVTWT